MAHDTRAIQAGSGDTAIHLRSASRCASTCEKRKRRNENSAPTRPAMTLGNMRALGVKRLLASCLNDACKHQGLIDVSGYPADTEVPWFRSRVKCAKCGGRGNDRRPAELERTTAER